MIASIRCSSGRVDGLFTTPSSRSDGHLIRRSRIADQPQGVGGSGLSGDIRQRRWRQLRCRPLRCPPSIRRRYQSSCDGSYRLAALTAAIALAAPGSAITNGVADESEHPYVGQLLFYVPDAERLALRRSGQLVQLHRARSSARP